MTSLLRTIALSGILLGCLSCSKIEEDRAKAYLPVLAEKFASRDQQYRLRRFDAARMAKLDARLKEAQSVMDSDPSRAITLGRALESELDQLVIEALPAEAKEAKARADRQVLVADGNQLASRDPVRYAAVGEASRAMNEAYAKSNWQEAIAQAANVEAGVKAGLEPLAAEVKAARGNAEGALASLNAAGGGQFLQVELGAAEAELAAARADEAFLHYEKALARFRGAQERVEKLAPELARRRSARLLPTLEASLRAAEAAGARECCAADFDRCKAALDAALQAYGSGDHQRAIDLVLPVLDTAGKLAGPNP